MRSFKKNLVALLIVFQFWAYSQEVEGIYLDFRNQEISDIIYSIAEISGENVLLDETVTGKATFRFEDKDFESALKRFVENNQLYVEKEKGAYKVSKIQMKEGKEGKYELNAENVPIEAFLTVLSRKTAKTIVYDTLPKISVTIRTKEASLEDIINLAIVKVYGFVLERIADGYYITKSSGNINKRNIDIFTLTEEEGKYSINIQKATFSSVIESCFKKAGKEYSLLGRPNVQLESLYYKDKSFNALLRVLLEQANCDSTEKDGIYYIYEIQKKDVVKKLKETKIIKPKYISTENVMAIMPNELNSSGFVKADKENNIIILTGSETEINPIEDFVKKIDVPVEGRKYKSFYMENVETKEVSGLIPKKLLFSEIIMLPSENGFVTQVTEESEKELSEFIKIIDRKKKNYAIKLKYIKSEELLKALPPSASKENIKVAADERIVFFTGSENQYETFSKELLLIDKPKEQIKYQLLVVQRQKNEGYSRKASLGASDSHYENIEAEDNSGYSWSGLVSNIFNINFDIISNFGVQFAGTLNAELSEGKSRVLADTTLNGISGESLTFSNTNTYRYRDIIVDTDGELYTSTTREISSGLSLSIEGWASGDGMVTVKVDAQISKQGSTETPSGSSADTTNPPSTSEKKVSTNVRTKSGTPVVIGGLIQQEEDITEKKVPILGSIPLLGRLFKSRTTNLAETEFVIYLVPFIEENKKLILTEEENLERLIKKYEKKV